MSAPPPGDGYGQFQQPDQPAYDEQPATPGTPQPDHAHGKKKKRAYAAQAFEVGAGANAAVGGQMQGGGPPYGAPPAQPGQAYGGYPQAVDPQPAAAAAQGYQYPQAYGAPQVGAPQTPGYGGYPAPDQGYPAPGAQPGAPGVAGITQGMAGMQMGGQPQPAPSAAGAPRPVALNQLYPTDLLNQPFNVSELDLPPPPIILPPNVSFSNGEN